MASKGDIPSEMLSVTVHPTDPITTTFSRIPVPTSLAPNEVLVKVHAAGSNPKDWLHLVARNISLNSGDDLSGTIAAVGSSVARFQVGDRVAAFHPMFAPYGAYAEYAVAPAHTVFKIPDALSYEEAATIPLVMTTAALTLFRRQGFLAPWDIVSATGKEVNTRPLVVYAASTSLGTYVIKLAKLAGIGPIIAIGGGSSEYLKSLLDEKSGDVFLDYRSGMASVQDAVKQIGAERGLALENAVDAYNENSSWVHIAQMLSAGGKVSVFSGAKKYDESSILPSVSILYTFVGTAHEGAYKPGMPKQPPAAEVPGDVEFAGRLFEWLEKVIGEGKFTGHPFELISGGLEGVAEGLNRLRDGKAGGKKLVYSVVQAQKASGAVSSRV